MKVKFDFTLDISAADWELNYGIADRAEIRKDAKQYAEEIVRNQFGQSGITVTN
jgi:hypothetical protein